MNNTRKSNISDVYESKLCTGCGTCEGICPSFAIEIIKDDLQGIYIPKVNINKCNYCGICLKCCPGWSLDFIKLNQKIFGKQPENPLIGNYIDCHIGHANDNDLRWKASSGGVLTQLLIFAMENKLINGVILTRMSQKNPLEPEVFIARNREDVISATGSKYCPVPVNIKLKEVLKDENGKFALVGLPCHIQAFRKSELINSKLKDKIILVFGLFCNHCPKFTATEYLLKKLNINKEEITDISYRGSGWPGKMTILLNDEKKLLMDQSKYWNWGFGEFFIPLRCTFCLDGLSEFADISFGDAWLPELKIDKLGTSIIVVRTEKGQQIIQEAINEKKVDLELINSDKVIRSQNHMLNFKNEIKVRITLSRKLLLMKKFPKYVHNKDLVKPTIISYFKNTILYMKLFISSKEVLWSIIPFYVNGRKLLLKILRI